MISPKKLIKLAKKWQRMVASKRERISFPGTTSLMTCGTSSATVEKGHFVVYSADQRRFVIPLQYLKNVIIKELFQIAEEKFGLPSSGPITLPCSGDLMDYIISLIQRRMAKEIEKALLVSLATARCKPFLNLCHEQSNQGSIICGF